MKMRMAVGLGWLLALGAAHAETLTVATYNLENYVPANRVTEAGYRTDYPKPEAEKRALRAVIRGLDADILVLQEMGPQAYLDELRRDLKSEGRVYPHAALATAIDALPGRKLIFTNGSRRHAERVAEKLGVLHLIEDICDIAACGFVPKPEPDAFRRMVARHGVTPGQAAMFDDMPHNLEAPHALGMTTVLVHSDYLDHPAQVKMRSWTELPAHINYATDRLADFLGSIRPALAA